MFNSTDPYNYGQNSSVEYNQNGNSYNGSTGGMTSGSIMNAGMQGGGSTSSTSSNNPFESFLTHAMALSNYVNGQGPTPGQNAGQNQNGTGGTFPVIPIEQPYTPPIMGRQPGYGMPQPPVNLGNDVGIIWQNGQPSPSRPGVTGTIGQPPALPTGNLTGVGQAPGQTPYDTGGYLGPNVSPAGQSGLTGITGDNPTPNGPVGGLSPTGQTWNGGPTFVQGYGWTQTPEEFQAANAQVQQQQQANASAQNAPATPAANPAAPGVTAPQGGSVQDMIHKLLSPLFQQQQGDLTRQMNANAAVTGDINAGGYSGTGPSSLNRQLSNLMAQQGAQEGGYLQTANEDALQRQLQLELGQLGLQGTKYSADQGLAGARYGSAATASAAQTAANASMHNADQNYNLGLGNLDVSRENNLMNFMANMYGMTPQMLSALLAGSPESLLTGQTVPTGNIVVKP